MEAIVQPVTWDQWSAQTRTFFEKLRSGEGEHMVLEGNLFIESLLPQRVLRNAHRRGDGRLPAPVPGAWRGTAARAHLATPAAH
jgi:hypothetical protein